MKQTGARVRGVTGSAVVPTVHVRSLEFGELRLEDVTLPIVPRRVRRHGRGARRRRAPRQAHRDRIPPRPDSASRARASSRRRPTSRSCRSTTCGRTACWAQLLLGPVPTISDHRHGRTGHGRQHWRCGEALARHRGEKDPFDDAIIGVTEDVQPATRVRVPSIVAGELIVLRAEIRFADLHIFEHWNLTSRPALMIGMTCSPGSTR